MELLQYLSVGAGILTEIFDEEEENPEHQINKRYDLFITKGPEEALQVLKQAYKQTLIDPPELIRFDEDGFLAVEYEPKRESLLGLRKTGGDEVDDTIKVTRYKKESLLEIELLDVEMNPISDNIMISRYLRSISQRNT